MGMVVGVGFGVVVLVLIGMAVVFGSRRDGGTAAVTGTTPVAPAPAVALPPIDAAAPAETEVATFALG
jgi:predicted cobalt transporter CbtA